jgi:hypothetical protein
LSLLNSHHERIRQLQEFGLTKNESLIYLSLLEDDSSSGISGYEVAARSEVPRSAVYTLLSKLEDIGAVFSQGKPLLFSAVPPAQWLDRCRIHHQSMVQQLQESLSTVSSLSQPAPIWIIRRYSEVIKSMEELVRSASRFLCLSILPQDLEILQPLISNSDQLRVLIHVPGPYPHNISGSSCWFEHSAVPIQFNRIVLVDGQQSLQGFFSPELSNDVIRSENRSLYHTCLSLFGTRIQTAANALDISPSSDLRLLEQHANQVLDH